MIQDARDVRYRVFVLEQDVPVDIEQDARDGECTHVVAYDNQGRAVGTGRLLPDAHIGRMAVLSAYRGQGIGSDLLKALIHDARCQNYPEVFLSAQLHAMAFYQAHGFASEGAHYFDAGIEHVRMRQRLSDL